MDGILLFFYLIFKTKMAISETNQHNHWTGFKIIIGEKSELFQGSVHYANFVYKHCELKLVTVLKE